MANWTHYFHFPTGTKFHIDGPFGYDGEGRVVENLPQKLKLRLDLDAWGPAPALHTTVTIEYRQEGQGNLAIVEEDGKPAQQDNNATIVSDDFRRERRITSNAATFSVRFERANEIDFDIYYGTDHYDFDFERR